MGKGLIWFSMDEVFIVCVSFLGSIFFYFVAFGECSLFHLNTCLNNCISKICLC